MRRNNWYHVSSHGAVLFCIAALGGCTINDLAEAMSLTRRRVQGIIRDLRQAEMLHVRKKGRRHHYAVNLDAPFHHPALKGYTLRPILGALVGQAGQR
jgi:DNA-binding transcriptional ArsR family regulator